MAPQSAPPPRAQTIKQAKAAYQSRNRSTLTERERKQIERSIELERRAERAKEVEKRRVQARAKREEKELMERGSDAVMTSQRRCDRFGFVGSQMHLGAFFGGGGVGPVREKLQAGGAAESQTAEDEEFAGGSLDDEAMLDALAESNDEKAVRSGTQPAVPEQSRLQMSDLDLFRDDLESSTQIARDLATESARPTTKPKSLSTSFGSEEFDLSVEDIEEAQSKDGSLAKTELDKKLMPPPALPTIKPSPLKKTSTGQSTTFKTPASASAHRVPLPGAPRASDTARIATFKAPSTHFSFSGLHTG